MASILRELTDFACRTALRIAYPLAVIWWTLRGLDGTKIAVWANGRVLLVRHSYKPGWKLPGGGLKASEDHKSAAHRELLEEVGLAIDPSALRLVLTTRCLHGLIYLYEVRLDVEPVPAIDRREIVAATFQVPAAAAERDAAVQRYLRD